jgi:hypothetical protein
LLAIAVLLLLSLINAEVAERGGVPVKGLKLWQRAAAGGTHAGVATCQRETLEEVVTGTVCIVDKFDCAHGLLNLLDMVCAFGRYR